MVVVSLLLAWRLASLCAGGDLDLASLVPIGSLPNRGAVVLSLSGYLVVFDNVISLDRMNSPSADNYRIVTIYRTWLVLVPVTG